MTYQPNVTFLTDAATKRLQVLVKSGQFETIDDAASFIVTENTIAESSELFTTIAKFYRGNDLPAASFIDLVLLAGRITHSLAAGSSVEIIAFDGTVKRARTIAQSNLFDTAECLRQLSVLIVDRLDRMGQDDLDRLDRATQMLNGINGS